MNPRGWTKTELEEWLKNPLTQERKGFDLKAIIPPHDAGKNDLKKDFCGFANGTGGFLFFGIKDDKSIIGINEDNNFTTRISEIVTKHIFPTTILWDLCACIKVDSGKCVYVIEIIESPYWQKPHVFFRESDGLFIPLRENGNKRNITDGSELRRICLKTDNYYPEYNTHVLNILRELKNKPRPFFSLTDAVIIQGYKSFLRSQSETQYGQILIEIENIEMAVAELNKKHFSGVADGNPIVSADQDGKLGKLVDDFVSNFGRQII
ncbi:MAG: ATP-binding protein [Patescibacteria group bacterium]|nr:ATP-binding protein [Patescibacteria group bacterium]